MSFCWRSGHQVFGYPYLLWGQCALGEETEQNDEFSEHFELMRASEASAGARRHSVTVDTSESVKHEAPKKGEPEKYPSAGARSRWGDENGDDEFTPSQNYGAGRKQRPALPQAMEESSWVRTDSSNPHQ